MSPGDTALDHAETRARDVSSDAWRDDSVGGQDAHGQSGRNHDNGETRANGTASTSNPDNHLSAEAGPSKPRSVGSGRSASPQQSSTPKVPTKRRRLDAELAFSSPGPAFQLGQQDSDAQAENSDSSGRTRRPRRITTLTNGNGDGSGSSDSRHRRPSASTRQGETDHSKTVLDSNAPNKLSSSKGSRKKAYPNERAYRESSTSSVSPNRSRSRSKSAVESEPDQDSATVVQSEVPTNVTPYLVDANEAATTTQHPPEQLSQSILQPKSSKVESPKSNNALATSTSQLEALFSQLLHLVLPSPK